MHHPDARQPETVHDAFFPGCLTLAGTAADLAACISTDTRRRIIIADPQDALECIDVIGALAASIGLRLAVTFEAPSSELRCAWKSISSAPLQDYCLAWDAGVMMYTCEYGHRHFNPATCRFDSANTTTSLLNRCQDFSCWDGGDTYQLESPERKCECGRGWLGYIESRRDAHLTMGSRLVRPGSLNIDPLPGMQVFQDVGGSISLRYDDWDSLNPGLRHSATELATRIAAVYGSCPFVVGRVKRGTKIPLIYSLSARIGMRSVIEL